MKLATSGKNSALTVMADSLDERTLRNSIPNDAQANPNPNRFKANSIDDTLEQKEDGLYYKNPNPNSIDEKLKLDKKTSLLGKAWDLIKYSPIAAAQFAVFGPVVTLSTLITVTGFTIGGYFQARKEGKKFTWRRARRDLYSGNIFGFLDYGIYKIPEYFANFIPYLGGATLMAKIAKTLFFGATVIPAAVTAYKSIEYIRDEMGWKSFFKKLFTLKWGDIHKDVYENAIKGKILKSSLPIWAIGPFLHFPQLNYLPNVQARMAQAAFVNNPIFRYILGRQKSKQESTKSEQEKAGQEYKPEEKKETATPEKKEPGALSKLAKMPGKLYNRINKKVDEYFPHSYKPKYAR